MISNVPLGSGPSAARLVLHRKPCSLPISWHFSVKLCLCQDVSDVTAVDTNAAFGTFCNCETPLALREFFAHMADYIHGQIPSPPVSCFCHMILRLFLQKESRPSPHPLTLSLTMWFASDDKLKQAAWCANYKLKLQETAFLPALWCFCHHHKAVFCPKERKRHPVVLKGGWELRKHSLSETSRISHLLGSTQNEWAVTVKDHSLRLCISSWFLHSNNPCSSEGVPAIRSLTRTERRRPEAPFGTPQITELLRWITALADALRAYLGLPQARMRLDRTDWRSLHSAVQGKRSLNCRKLSRPREVDW